eukprot:SAG31_NODE_435_length_15733_cov_6.508251_20_plen_34_part_00
MPSASPAVGVRDLECGRADHTPRETTLGFNHAK